MELKDATVLLVEDEPMLLGIFCEWLEEENCHVLTAGDGAAALQILRDHHVDVLVSDVRMPVMDGILLLKNLTTHAGASQSNNLPKMIFITGFADLEPRDAYGLGVEAIMQKPIKHAEFVGAIRRTLQSPEEIWAEPSTTGGVPLNVALYCVSAAIEQGRIEFGRGGFCLQYSPPIKEGPVRFDLEFEAEKVSLRGHGLVRWVESDERLLGVEILSLDESCRRWATAVIAANAGSTYIPRGTLSAITGTKTAK
jgi:CheY-like chemotaxis protein